MNGLIIDNFAGGGGASTGIETALGRPIDVAINHDAEAVAMHAVNHPQTHHLCQNVWKADPVEVVAEASRRRGSSKPLPIELAWFSPDCFPAGTLVLTREGYRPIEEIEVGDEVLSHAGKWRAVTETSSAVRPVVTLRGHGHPGLTLSVEHPVYARLREDVWSTEPPRGYRRNLGPRDWLPASMLGEGWYWATPHDFPAAEAPPVGGRGFPIDGDFMWLVGRYLGDGWTRLTETRAELVITCGRHEVDALRTALSKWARDGARAGEGELAWHERDTATAHQFSTNHRGLVEWLRRHFGHRAEAKRIPGWALGMEPLLRQALLDGYLSADGWRGGQFTEARTVSNALAFGLKALLNGLGKTVTIHRLANSATIEGRAVSARPINLLRWRVEVSPKHAQTFRDDLHEWCPIRERIDEGAVMEVFNIGVDVDESYVVEGVVVHNCKHFSKAKGSKPVEKGIRDLAWVVVHWARRVKPNVIMLENVEEFCDWGPLIETDDGRLVPCPVSKGLTFKRWVRELKKLGYKVEHRQLRASDYATPTIRRRLYVIARRDGLPIVWPSPSNAKGGAGGLAEWRWAAECIDFDLPCPSIFTRKKALAENTLRRIARGVMRYVVNADKPFIVGVGGRMGQSPERPVDVPMQTLTAKGDSAIVQPIVVSTAHGGTTGRAPYAWSVDEPLRTQKGSPEYGIVQPFVAGIDNKSNGDRDVWPSDEPLRTVTLENRFALVAPLTHQGGDRGQALDQPLATVTGAHRGEQALIAAHVTKFRTGSDGHPITDPLHTVTANSYVKRPGGAVPLGLVSAVLVPRYGERPGQEPRARAVDEPMASVVPTGNGGSLAGVALAGVGGPTYGGKPVPVDKPFGTLTTENHRGVVAAFLAQHNSGNDGHDLREAVSTIVGKGCTQGLVAAALSHQYSSNTAGGQGDLATPAKTVTAGGGHHALLGCELSDEDRAGAERVAAFLVKYYSAAQHGQSLKDPLHSATSKPRFGLVTVMGLPIVDIGLRMLTPRELFRAQGFPESYIIDHGPDGKALTKTAQTRMCGNSVCPPVAEALVRANLVDVADVGERAAD